VQAQAQARRGLEADQLKAAHENQGIDWKLVILCALAALGLAAVVVAAAIYNNM
jgi:hypothetical protein